MYPSLGTYAFWKTAGVGLVSQIATRWGNVAFSLGGGITTLPLTEKSTKPALRPQRRDTDPFFPWAVPQGTQGTQKLGGGFLRHLRHLRHWLGIPYLHQPLSVAAVAAKGHSQITEIFFPAVHLLFQRSLPADERYAAPGDG